MSSIAILQYKWPLQSHTANFVRSLAADGFEVDLILKGCETNLVDIDSLVDTPRVRIIDLDQMSRKRPLLNEKITITLQWYFELSVRRFMFTPILWPTLVESLGIFRSHRYDCLIGVEKKGMIWAGLVHRLTGIPFIYFSLELYDEQHPYFFNSPGFSALRRSELFHHRKALATIVQDRQRGDHLMQSNGIAEANMIYLPVSVTGDPILERGDFFETRFAIPKGVPMVVFLGFLVEWRHCLEVARVARRNADRFVVVFHGYGEASFLEKIRNESGSYAILSTDMVQEDRLPDVIASAHIGLALYRKDCANDRLTAFSSEKVALYCRGGVPFIAFDTESYRSLKSRFDCCVLIRDVEEIPDAVQEILANYERYRKNAFQAFMSVYRYSENVASAIGHIRELLTPMDGTGSSH